MSGTSEPLRAELYALIHKHFAGDNTFAAQALSQISGKRVSERTIQAWLIAPGRVSSRNCPPWAVARLKEYVSNPENEGTLTLFVSLARDDGPLSHAARVESQSSVSLATSLLEGEQACRKEWRQTPLSELAAKCAESQNECRQLDHRFEAFVDAVSAAISKSHDLALKETFNTMRRNQQLSRYHVNTTRRDIENKQNEFSDESLLESSEAIRPSRPDTDP
ncbi:MAG: hypothetical protein ACXWCY_26865 [Burkholderiales bacterium]